MPNAVARDATAPRCFAHDLPDELFTSDALDEICRAAGRPRPAHRADPRQLARAPRAATRADAAALSDPAGRARAARALPHLQHRDRGARAATPSAARGCSSSRARTPSLGDIPRETVVRVFSPARARRAARRPRREARGGHRRHDGLVRAPRARDDAAPAREPAARRVLPAVHRPPGGACRCSSIRAARASSRRAGRTGSTTPATMPASRSTSASTRATTCAAARSTTSTGCCARRTSRPAGPGGRLDRLKCLAFDGISTATRRGLQYRGHV